MHLTWTKWTEEETKALLSLFEEKKAPSEIAIILRRTRNSIIGRLHRLGKSADNRPKRPPMPRAARAPRRAIPRLIFAKKETQRAKPPVGGKPILELNANECRWPLGDPLARPPHKFCSADTDGSPYCERHQLAAYVPVKLRTSRPIWRGNI